MCKSYAGTKIINPITTWQKLQIMTIFYFIYYFIDFIEIK